jgi:hypothetical protein
LRRPASTHAFSNRERCDVFRRFTAFGTRAAAAAAATAGAAGALAAAATGAHARVVTPGCQIVTWAVLGCHMDHTGCILEWVDHTPYYGVPLPGISFVTRTYWLSSTGVLTAKERREKSASPTPRRGRRGRRRRRRWLDSIDDWFWCIVVNDLFWFIFVSSCSNSSSSSSSSSSSNIIPRRSWVVEAVLSCGCCGCDGCGCHGALRRRLLLVRRHPSLFSKLFFIRFKTFIDFYFVVDEASGPARRERCLDCVCKEQNASLPPCIYRREWFFVVAVWQPPRACV